MDGERFHHLEKLILYHVAAPDFPVDTWGSILASSPKLAHLSLKTTAASFILDSLLPLAPRSLTGLTLGFRRGDNAANHVDLTTENIMRWLRPFTQLINLKLVWLAKGEMWELSFNTFLNTLSQFDDSGTFICPALRVLRLNRASVDQEDLGDLLKSRNIDDSHHFGVELTQCFGFPNFATFNEDNLRKACGGKMATLPFYPGEADGYKSDDLLDD
jgi:hypothetical protein